MSCQLSQQMEKWILISNQYWLKFLHPSITLLNGYFGKNFSITVYMCLRHMAMQYKDVQFTCVKQ